MLVRFSIENFKSFADRQELTLAKGLTRKHKNHVIESPDPHGVDVLKCCVLYGANASGKTNLVRAMDFAKKFITRPKDASSKILVKPFRLDYAKQNAPTRFEFEINIGDQNYAYGFIVNDEAVLEEWLYRIDRTKDVPIFERQEDSFNFDGLNLSKENRDFIGFVSQGTHKKRLFLTECRERDVFRKVDETEVLKAVYDWFKEKLVVIFPNSKFRALEAALHKHQPLKELYSRLMASYGTGVSSLELIKVEIEDLIQRVPEEIKAILTRVETEPTDALVQGPDQQRYFLSQDKDGKQCAYRLMTKHRMRDKPDEETYFELREESDGTRRLIDLLPAFISMLGGDAICVIDEMNRSLHSELTLSFVSNFLRYSSKKRSQLIFTTHETNLLDQKVLRRDEIWLVDRAKDGSSSLKSLYEFKLRHDKEIERDYLNGRFGGVPVIKDFSWLGAEDA